jgi:hypothetical protein
VSGSGSWESDRRVYLLNIFSMFNIDSLWHRRTPVPVPLKPTTKLKLVLYPDFC